MMMNAHLVAAIPNRHMLERNMTFNPFKTDLFKETPEPGKTPEYVDAVGKTHLPIMLLEGGRTPNRWGINSLSHELEKSGSKVIAKVIP